MNFHSIKKFSSVIIILLAVTLGLLLPNVGLIWEPYVPLILGLVMFVVALNIDLTGLLRSIRDYRLIAFSLVLIFVLPPILSLPGTFLFSPIYYLAVVLALSGPAAISSVFLCDIFGGFTPLALTIRILTNLLAIITIPTTILLTFGVAASFDVTAIILNLVYLIVVPVSAAQAARKLFSKTTKQIVSKGSTIQQLLVFFLIWGAVSPGSAFLVAQPRDFFYLIIFFLSVFTIIFLIAYLGGRHFGRLNAIALGVVSSYKNSTLTLVIGLLLLGPGVSLPLIANIVAQNIFLIPAKLAIGNG